MQIEMIKTSELIPYEKNPRKNDAAVDKVAASIKEFGFLVPIVIDRNNEIAAGHTRLKAALQLGIDRVPCVRANDLTDEQIKAFRLADNKTAEFAEWDFTELDKQLEELMSTDIDMSLFGFTFDEDPPEITEDEPPEVNERAEPVTKRGDIWLLGNHRLMCGSSTDAKDIARLMGGAKAKILFTSPPYSDMRTYEGGKDLSVSNLVQFISHYKSFAEYQCVNLGIQRKDHEIVQYWDEYIAEARRVGYKLMAWNVWDKTIPGSVGSQSAFFPIRHEFVFVFGEQFYEINRTWEKAKESIYKGKKARTVRQADGHMEVSTTGDLSSSLKQMESVLQLMPVHGKTKEGHPAPFPVGLPSEYIKSMTNKDENVIEPFCGSGTTLIACEQLERNCFAMELEPKYCDVIVKRWEDFTGKKAVKENA